MAEMHILVDPEKELFGAKESGEKEASLLQNLRRWPGRVSQATLSRLLLLFLSLGLFLLLVAILVQANVSRQIQSGFEGLHQQLVQMNTSLTGSCHPCPLNWELFQGSCYFFSGVQRNWKTSQSACQAQKAQLVIINREEEEKFLQFWGARTEESTWIGLSDQHSEGSWRWVDGSPLGISFWREGEPNSHGDEDCAELQEDGWNDGLCSLKHGYICEKPQDPCSRP